MTCNKHAVHDEDLDLDDDDIEFDDEDELDEDSIARLFPEEDDEEDDEDDEDEDCEGDCPGCTCGSKSAKEPVTVYETLRGLPDGTLFLPKEDVTGVTISGECFRIKAKDVTAPFIKYSPEFGSGLRNKSGFLPVYDPDQEGLIFLPAKMSVFRKAVEYVS